MVFLKMAIIAATAMIALVEVVCRLIGARVPGLDFYEGGE